MATYETINSYNVKGIVLINVNCFSNEFKSLDNIKTLQLNNTLNTAYMIRVYEVFFCSIPLSDDKRYNCETHDKEISIIEKIDSTLAERCYDLYYNNVDIKVRTDFINYVNIWLNNVKNDLLNKGYHYYNFTADNIGFIGDRLVLTDLQSLGTYKKSELKETKDNMETEINYLIEQMSSYSKKDFLTKDQYKLDGWDEYDISLAKNKKEEQYIMNNSQ